MCGVTASTWIVAAVLQTHACSLLKNFFTLGNLGFSFFLLILTGIGACTTKRDLFYPNLVFRFVVDADIAGDILST